MPVTNPSNCFPDISYPITNYEILQFINLTEFLALLYKRSLFLNVWTR